jgi:hypothetical protein
MLLHGASLFRWCFGARAKRIAPVYRFSTPPPFRFCLNFQIFCAEMGSRTAVKKSRLGVKLTPIYGMITNPISYNFTEKSSGK